MEYLTQEITLKRHEKKLWQFGDQKPARVELAVLDYLRSEGWSGYFTEHFDYDETLIFMMCWPDHKKIGPRKTASDVHLLFHSASDGFIRDEKPVGFSRLDLIENAQKFQRVEIPKILRLWQDKPSLKTDFIGRAYLKPRHASELCSEDLTSYYDAVGGREYFVDCLERRFPSNLQKLSSRARALTEEVRKRNDLGPMPNLMDSCMGFYNITNAARYPIGKYMTPAGIKRFSANTLKREPRFLAEEIVKLANEIIKARHEHLSVYSPPEAVLDLKLWRDGRIANVEVKAPNDRLRENQKSQLIKDKKEKINSFVVTVKELA